MRYVPECKTDIRNTTCWLKMVLWQHTGSTTKTGTGEAQNKDVTYWLFDFLFTKVKKTKKNPTTEL